jgi:hypothetical protein
MSFHEVLITSLHFTSLQFILYLHQNYFERSRVGRLKIHLLNCNSLTSRLMGFQDATIQLCSSVVVLLGRTASHSYQRNVYAPCLCAGYAAQEVNDLRSNIVDNTIAYTSNICNTMRVCNLSCNIIQEHVLYSLTTHPSPARRQTSHP